jgi:hypothetical protein
MLQTGACLREHSRSTNCSASIAFFKRGRTAVRMWNRVLEADEVADLFASDTVPEDELVAEYLVPAGTGTTSSDSAGGNDGTIRGATWARSIDV